MQTPKLNVLGVGALALVATLLLVSGQQALAEKRKDFKIAWSIYVGWMPWEYAARTGIVKKWADRYGINIEVVQINDYVESINQYTAGQYDGCTMTNMDALTIPAAGGVDSTALIIGDFSNGNDGVVLKNARGLADIAGRRVNLVELSVSHYLLARALDSAGLSERDITVVNTSDADIVAAYATDDVDAVVTWNPLLSEVLAMPDSLKVFDSSRIPGEIIDMLVVNTRTLEANPDLGKALTGAWYETMRLMSADTAAGATARESMGKASGTDLAGFEAQLASTQMFFEPGEAVAFAKSDKLIGTMDHVRNFSFSHGILGEGARTPDAVGMRFANGKTLGDTANIKLRFDATFMTLAAEGRL
ncbi:MAG: putative urea ABC transporter substrate-binding protein [Gammaproteobacteria bacterium]|nr:putative urea ABC transporter substrate-binding protein [Gammaproteobacteria bacterium]